MIADKPSISIKVQIVIEPDGDSFFGWSPDLEGAMAEGETEQETTKTLRMAIFVHMENMLKNELPLPSQIVQEPGQPKQKHQNPRQPENGFADSTVKRATADLQMSISGLNIVREID